MPLLVGRRDECHLDRLKNDKSLIAQKLFLACGTHRREVAEELRILIDELADIGFELFSIRTAALGLAEYQVRRLYNGSADYQKYGTQPAAITQGQRFAGVSVNP